MKNPEHITESRGYLFGLTLNGDGSATTLGKDTNPALPRWVHLDYEGADCLTIMKELELPEAAIDGLVRADARPRALSIRNGVLLNLRGVNLNPGQDPEDMVSLRLWIEKGQLVSVRHRRILAAQDIRDELGAGKGPVSIQDLLFVLIEKLATRISDFIDGLEERIDGHELAEENTDPLEMRSKVLQIRRQAAAVRRFLAPQREALESFTRHAKDLMDENYILFIHEQSDRILRYVEDLDLVRERSMVMQEELMNRMAQEQNNRMYELSLVAAIFLPISFVTGLFGMNVAGLPGLNNPSAFFYVSVFMVVVVIGIFFWFRKRKWM
jgi:zinc transporter